MKRGADFLVLALACSLVAGLNAQSSRTPAPSASPNGTLAVSTNTSGSLGNLCSSQAGILTALQGVASGSNSARLNVTVPSNLSSNASALQQVAQIAWQYIVTYPLPLIAKSLAAASGNATAINTFYLRNNHLANYNDTGGVTPNHDTLYNQAFLDLSQGPVVVTVPKFDTPKRYWIVPFLDAYLNFYGAIGSHFNSSAGDYLVVGRNTPASQTFQNFTSDRIFRSPTDINWVIGRVLVLNDSDNATAYNFSAQYKIRQYNASVNVSTNASSKAAIISRAVNGSGYGALKNSVGFLDGFSQQPAQWFNVSATFLNTDPPVNGSTAQQITTFTGLSRNASNSANSAAFQLGAQVAKQCITATQTGLRTSTGWTFHNTTGVYNRASGVDYLLRAQDTRYIPAALPPTEVIYFLLDRDSENRTLDASSGANYTATFSLPVPARGFWSFTIYNSTNLLLFKNPINRYSIGDRTPGLVYGGTNNSTLEVFISATAPRNGTSQYANWLPAPTNAPFQFILRTYEPPQSAIIGQYAPPALVRIAPPGAASAGR